jgi:hypothetical protein
MEYAVLRQEYAIVFNLDREVAEEYLSRQQHPVIVARASDHHAVCNVKYWKVKLVSIAFKVGFPPFVLI